MKKELKKIEEKVNSPKKCSSCGMYPHELFQEDMTLLKEAKFKNIPKAIKICKSCAKKILKLRAYMLESQSELSLRKTLALG